MKTLCAVLFGLAALTAPAQADVYANPRFGYELDYPSGFTAGPEPENGDGLEFTAKHGGAKLAVWGNYNANDQTPNDIAVEAAGDCLKSPAPYRLVKPTVVVVSCQTAHGILYHKTLIRGDVMMTFEFTYPVAERAQWDPLVTKIKLAPAPK